MSYRINAKKVGGQLRRFMDLHMEAIDNDPKVRDISRKLSVFTMQIAPLYKRCVTSSQGSSNRPRSSR